MRAWIFVGLAGCARVEAIDTDPVVDTDVEVVPPACDYAPIAGDWSGTMIEGPNSYGMTMHLEAVAELDELVGLTTFEIEDGCTAELMCVGKTQLEAYVLTEYVTSGPCFDAFVFLLPMDDGTLTFEEAHTEFGERVTTATLSRVE